MSIYTLLRDYQKNKTILFLLKKGAISLSLLDKLTYYEFYLKELQINNIAKAIQITAVEYNVSDMTIRRAIKYMES